ncbi:MAG: hypothetical protein NVSMB65_09570 [Chloroflexota bacterium]
MSHQRVLFFGMEGTFSREALAVLLGAGCPVCAVVVPRGAVPGAGAAPVRLPRRRQALPVLGASRTPTLASMAAGAGVPVVEVGQIRHPAVLAALGDLRPTVIGVACFPWLLPGALLRLPVHGAVNVHPSLLPSYRGPAPLFWIFHDGLDHAGVTVHVMTGQADAGPSLRQSSLPLPAGIASAEAERLLAREGGRWLGDAIGALHARMARPVEQQVVEAPRAPLPGAGDLVVTAGWSARRAFNFIRGLRDWERPVVVQVGTASFPVLDAESYEATATLPVPLRRLGGNRMLVRCTPGTVTVAVRPHPPA